MTMRDCSTAAIPRTSSPNPPDAAPAGGHATLIVDGRGCVLGCDAAARRMLGRGFADLHGKPIAEFIAGLAFSLTSPSHRARYVAHLCTNTQWREFGIVGANGREFPVQARFSVMSPLQDGLEIFVVRLRESAP